MADSLGQLQQWRAAIDHIDDQLLVLFNQRAEIAGHIGQLKSGVLYRPEREAQILRRLIAANAGPLSDETVATLIREVMSACLAHERPITVACLGPRGSFSEVALERHFGHAALRCYGTSWPEIFRLAESGEADFAVVPVENSTEGSVGLTLDHMLDTPLQVCGEVLLRVHHQLLVRAPLELAALTHVYSHSQSLGQCRQWLDQHVPQAERMVVASNSEAARLVSEGPATWAAIAGDSAGQAYGLTVLRRHVEDAEDNTTRFLVLGSLSTQPSGRDKTSLVVAVENRPGAIYQLLAPLAEWGVSMTRLESRPARTRPWSYVFFIDIEGHRLDASVAQALRRIEEQAVFLKVLGSYPVTGLP